MFIIFIYVVMYYFLSHACMTLFIYMVWGIIRGVKCSSVSVKPAA